jgi:hypothetical protein
MMIEARTKSKRKGELGETGRHQVFFLDLSPSGGGVGRLSFLDVLELVHHDVA